MKFGKIVIVLVALSMLWFGLYKVQAQPRNSIRYESGLFIVQQTEDVMTSIENIDSIAHNYRVIVSGTTEGSPLIVAFDSGTVSVGGGQGAHSDYVLPAGSPTNLYKVEIVVDSEKLIPTTEVFLPGIMPRYWQSGSQLTKFSD